MSDSTKYRSGTSIQVTQHADRRAEDVVCQVRSIGILLYDFEDFIEAQTFDKSKFDELQAATKELAITLVEKITRFTTKSALESSPAPSQFPPLPPLPPLPNPSDTARSSSQLSIYGRAQSRPSLTRGSEQRDRSHSAARALRAAGYSASQSPISPNGLASPISLPFSSQSAIPEQANEIYHYIPTHRRQESNPDVEVPQHVESASLPRTPRTGVVRWKFEKQRQPGWLALKKGEVIYNLAWEDPNAWFWSGSNTTGEFVIFPRSHVSMESVKDGSLVDADQRHRPKERNGFIGFFNRHK
ncbi:hypothetical protein DER46DRAFT_581630 [Fusarium sp. MPI-SDFR-AT-0072]|nr:hypothetical protein DER46DRAFT_581630 [Fusarium sp. MPI-SDFR-AT-0072]